MILKISQQKKENKMKFRKLSKDYRPKDHPWHIKKKKWRAWTQRDFTEFKKLAAIKFDDAKGEMNLVFPKVIEKFDPEKIVPFQSFCQSIPI